MSADRYRKRSSPPSEAHQRLARLASFNQWWLRSDLLNHLDLFLADLQHLLAAQECLLYLEEHSTGILTLYARSEPVSAPIQAQHTLSPDSAHWSLMREQWMNQHFAEVNTTCQHLFLALNAQAQTTAFAPLFSPSASTPLGLLMVYKNTAWKRADDLLLSQVSTLLALRLANQQMCDQLEQRHLITAFVRLLCTTPLDPSQEQTVRRQARLLGVDLYQPHLIALTTLAVPPGKEPCVAQVISQFNNEIEQRFPGALLVLQESAEVFCLLPLANHRDHAIAQLKQVERDLQPTMHLLIGVSNTSRSLQEYPRGYEEARDALTYAQHFQKNGVFQIHEVGPLRFLNLKEARFSRATDRYSLAIQKLAEYDQQYHADQVHTLETFLLAGGRYSQTARMMMQKPGKGIATGTVRQRVERMYEITEMDLLDSTLWLHLQLAILVHHIQEA